MVNSDLDKGFQRCSKTVMDNIADPNIVFDEDGVCNYWHEYQSKADLELVHGKEGELKWSKKVEEIKEKGKQRPYDCIIGVSGGVDSTFIAYLVKKAGLRPLVVHFDNGWNSEIAVKNIENIINYLNADLYTLVVDWEEFRDLQRAYIKAGVVDIEVLTDHAILATLYKLAAKHKIKYVISGANIETEIVLPKAWIYKKSDSVNIRAIHKKYGELELKTYPLYEPWKKLYYNKLVKLEFVKPINWMKYRKAEAKKLIEKEIGWKDYGGKHYESIFTKFYQAYILPTKFKIDKRKAHLSNLICSGQLSREEALEELKQPLYDDHELSMDKEFVAKKLGFSIEEFDQLMSEEPKSHFDYPTEGPIESHYSWLKPIKSVYKKLK